MHVPSVIRSELYKGSSSGHPLARVTRVVYKVTDPTQYTSKDLISDTRSLCYEITSPTIVYKWSPSLLSHINCGLEKCVTLITPPTEGSSFASGNGFFLFYYWTTSFVVYW